MQETLNAGKGTIADAMKRFRHLRLAIDRTWMLWNEEAQMWDVYQSRYRKPVGILVISTPDEAEAIAAFIQAAELTEGE